MSAHPQLRPQNSYKIVDPLLLKRKNSSNTSRELLKPDLILGHSHLSQLKSHKLILATISNAPRYKFGHKSLSELNPSQ